MVLQNGGTLEVNGVTFSQQVPGFPIMTVGKEYMVFLSISEDGKIGIVPLGEAGLYEVAAADSLHPLGSRSHSVTDDLRTLYGNSLRQLSRELGDRRGQ